MSSSPEHRSYLSRRGWLRIAAAGLTGNARAGELRSLPSVAEPGRDAALAALIERIRGAAASRRYSALERFISPDFRVEFDAGKGPKAFSNHWSAYSASSPVWELLQRLLSLSGTFYTDSLFAVPYVYRSFPADLDPLAHVVAVGHDVALREKPELGAARLATVSQAVLPLAKPLVPPVLLPLDSFVEVSHPDAGLCFAAASDVYSPSAHRAFFEKKTGNWHWISLAAATLADPPDLYRPRRRT